MACACGQTARYAGRRPKTFTTVLGPLTLERAYYHCDACQAGLCPRDKALGLHKTSLSPATTRMVGLAALSVSFTEAGELLEALAGVAVDPKQVERTAEALGRDVADDECKVVEPEPAAAPTMYLGLDGTGVPVRKSEVEGRRGKQPDGTAKTREVKLVTVWTAETRNADGLPERDPGSVTYSAAVESAASRATDPLPSPFAQRAYREAQRRGFDTAARRVVIGDGAEWIWNLSAEQFPGAIEIVDLYHAKGHLCDVAKALYGAGTDLAERWGKHRRDELEAGRIDAILTALHAHSQTCDEARKCIDCQAARESDQFSTPAVALAVLSCFVEVLKQKRMMAVVAVRNRVCAVLQTPVGAAVCVHRRGGVHSRRGAGGKRLVRVA